MNSEDHPHARVLAPDVRLPLPQLDVRVAQLQDPRAVDSVFCEETKEGEFAKVCQSTRQIITCIDAIYALTVNQAVIDSVAAKSKGIS